MKRNNLHSNENRPAKINGQQTEIPQAVLQREADQVSSIKSPPVSKLFAKAGFGGPWMLTLINILFLALLAYLGFHAAQNIRNSIKEPQIDTSTPVRPIHFADDARKIAAAKPLKDYPMIWKRNLFNISTKEVTAPGNKIAIEKIAIAKKDLGLKLVGTVVANDSDTSRALISNSDTRKQETYREGDTIGTVRIRKILRNKVIVSTPEGDRLLMVDIGGALRSSNPETHTPRRSAYGEYP